MSDLSPKTVYSAYRQDQKSGPLHRPLFVARILAISVACLGAIPTAYNLYLSIVHGIPFTQVSHRLEQYDLWVKNFDCKIDYKTVTAGDKATRVDVGACPTSNDIALKVTTVGGKSTYEWIAYSQLEQASKFAGLLSLISTEAEAEEAPKTLDQTTQSMLKLAQAAPPAQMQVRCEAMPQPGRVIRIISEGGKCYREHISAMRGKLDKREEVPCNTQCTPTKG
jgi:hypothetical protein